jgi:hypothetical protein
LATLEIDTAAAPGGPRGLARLGDASRAIGSPWFDALLFWGVPVLALIFVYAWLGFAAALPTVTAAPFTKALLFISSVLTYAHLIAVAPRAYMNREVFQAYRLRLTLVPPLLIIGLALSPALLAIGTVIGLFWDVHHSAMQNFGLSRIYDSKAGNDPHQLRTADLRFHWVLYVGPLAAGPALMDHLHFLDLLSIAGLSRIARLPGIFEGHLGIISWAALSVWVVVIGVTAHAYRQAMAAGYRLPVHKAALMLTTGGVSLIAWGFSSPFVAFVSINIYHALQYFALVWLKEGKRMMQTPQISSARALFTFCTACGMFGMAYLFARSSNITWLLAPFIACSLLHFWYDGFVWSVRKRQV